MASIPAQVVFDDSLPDGSKFTPTDLQKLDKMRSTIYATLKSSTSGMSVLLVTKVLSGLFTGLWSKKAYYGDALMVCVITYLTPGKITINQAELFAHLPEVEPFNLSRDKSNIPKDERSDDVNKTGWVIGGMILVDICQDIPYFRKALERRGNPLATSGTLKGKPVVQKIAEESRGKYAAEYEIVKKTWTIPSAQRELLGVYINQKVQ